MNIISFIRKPAIRFLITVLVLYIAWFALYDLWLSPAGYLDQLVSQNLIYSGTSLLQLFGYDVYAVDKRIILGPTSYLFIGNSCNGIDLWAIFSLFIIAYPGPWKKKLLFIMLGLLSIHVFNIVRVYALAIVLLHALSTLSFNHNYTFNILMYGYIFILWMIWIKKFGEKNLRRGPVRAQNT